jgi:hypothetical protein
METDVKGICRSVPAFSHEHVTNAGLGTASASVLYSVSQVLMKLAIPIKAEGKF